MKVDVLLFDLGGVLLDYTGHADLAALLPEPMSVPQVVARLGQCEYVEAFGLGAIRRDEFAARFVEDWRLSLTPAAFLNEFGRWPRGWLPGAQTLLAELRPRYRLAALSNNNEVHWQRQDEAEINGVFEVAISSHHVGLRKPDPAIYRVALHRLGVLPGAVAFFDDAQANVDAAAAVGMHAHRVDGVDGLRDALTRQGWL